MQRVKLVVFVPSTHADRVRQAMGDAGAGQIGNYGYCSFSAGGTGRFKPLAGANPAIGAVGAMEAVAEERIECVCDRALARAVIAAIRDAHPYEEVALDIYPLLAEDDL
jgi:hypothetical protein